MYSPKKLDTPPSITGEVFAGTDLNTFSEVLGSLFIPVKTPEDMFLFVLVDGVGEATDG